MPHLVLPLSGCLSRHTPTRATRGEARGHRSALAQNSVLMYPLLFPPFGLVACLVCPRHMVDWPQCVCAAVSRCRGLVHSRCQWWCDPLGNNGPCEVVCVSIAVAQPTLVTPDGREGWEGEGCDPSAFICGFVSLRRWAVVTGGSVHHGDTPLTHDDPDCHPNRSAFTLTGPSPNLRCWFGKGTPLIAAKPLSWVSPCLTSCCLCRGA